MPSQPARMRCGKLRYTDGADLSHSRNPHECAVANHSSSIFDSSISVATRTNALWQSTEYSAYWYGAGSQPARMRCGKEAQLAAPAEKILVATRANALWQSSPCLFIPMRVMVATRTNALWQRCKMLKIRLMLYVATRTNALWQSRAIVVPEPETPKA